jgi:hypothetical protein
MRKLLIGVLAVGLVLAGALFALVMPRHCPVNRAACGRIKEGMTRAEVEKILGGPPGDYRTRPESNNLLLFPPASGGLVPLPGARKSWAGDEVVVHVYFDGSIVWRKEHSDEIPADTSLVELIRWRLERLKERWLP